VQGSLGGGIPAHPHGKPVELAADSAAAKHLQIGAVLMIKARPPSSVSPHADRSATAMQRIDLRKRPRRHYERRDGLALPRPAGLALGPTGQDEGEGAQEEERLVRTTSDSCRDFALRRAAAWCHNLPSPSSCTIKWCRLIASGYPDVPKSPLKWTQLRTASAGRILIARLVIRGMRPASTVVVEGTPQGTSGTVDEGDGI
jgi:hypothetical protein